MRAWTRYGGFGSRLLLAQGLVVLAGSAILLAVAVLLAPGLFRTHVDRAVGPIPDELSQHLAIAFARATLISLSVATFAAGLTALGVAWFVTRRVVRPIRAMASAAQAVANGDYTTRVHQAGLGVEFDAVSEAFNQMARNMAATERTRAEILRDLAHEIRTPLTTVRGYHEALADGVFTMDPETYATIGAALSRVERLVRDIARVSSAEERRLDLRLQQTTVSELIESAIAAASHAYDAKGVRLVGQPPLQQAPVRVDRDRIQEVLDNLLANALRHTPPGGRVTVAARKLGQVVEIGVTDTGDGIRAEHLSRVFERFYRVDDARSRDRGGSGIGLAIARALVEVHGGRIRAESPGPGRGATFAFTLPLASGPMSRQDGDGRDRPATTTSEAQPMWVRPTASQPPSSCRLAAPDLQA